MAAKKALTGIIMTVWVFVSMVVIPLSTLSMLEKGMTIGGSKIRIEIYGLNTGLIFFLGFTAMILTAFAYSFRGKSEALFIFLRYVVIAIYEWIWAEGVQKMKVYTKEGVVYAGVYLGIWIIIVIVGSLLNGTLKALHKYAKAVMEEKKAESEG